MPNDEKRQLPRSIFNPNDRARILAQAVGKPTGVNLEIGGLSIELVALSTAQGREVLAIVRKVGAIYERISAKEATNIEIFEALGDDGPRALALIKDVLHRSVFHARDVNEPHAREEIELFNEWFEALPLAEILTQAIPAILAANGVTNLSATPTIRAPEPAIAS